MVWRGAAALRDYKIFLTKLHSSESDCVRDLAVQLFDTGHIYGPEVKAWIPLKFLKLAAPCPPNMWKSKPADNEIRTRIGQYNHWTQHMLDFVCGNFGCKGYPTNRGY